MVTGAYQEVGTSGVSPRTQGGRRTEPPMTRVLGTCSDLTDATSGLPSAFDLHEIAGAEGRLGCSRDGSGPNWVQPGELKILLVVYK